MSPIISVENISKAYRIGALDEVPDTIVGAAKGILTAPFKNLSRLRGLDTSALNSVVSSGADSLSDILWALKDVSFEVQEGDVVGVIGRNGAGKSTLLKILSRITEPTSGKVRIRGRVSSLLEVGTGFHPELTGRENIYMNGTILGMTKKEIDRKFDEIVEFSGVEKFLDTPTKRYSSGMQVRLAFAVAAHLEPEILVVDEVLAVGDAEFQKKCLGKMQSVAEGGKTVLFVSHQLNSIEALCSTGVELCKGEVAVTGKVGDVLEHYLSGVGQSELVAGYQSYCDGLGFSRVVLLNGASGQQSTVFSTRDNLVFEFDIKCGEYPSDLAISISLFDQKNVRVIAADSAAMTGKVFSISRDRTKTIRVEFPRIPLSPGRYRTAIALVCTKSRENLDRVEDQISFEVEVSDVFGTGHLPRMSSVVIPEVNWQFSVGD